jgi:uncharacterized protein
MLIHELTPDECRSVVSRTRLGRLACAYANQPYVVPVRFSFDADRNCVYGFSTVGQKVDWMRENPKVCLEVEEMTDTDHWTTVLIFGRYDEIPDAEHEQDARDRAQKLFQERAEWWLPAAAKVVSREPHAVVVYRVRIDRMTGRRAARDRAL